jgi:protein transport protein SEC24
VASNNVGCRSECLQLKPRIEQFVYTRNAINRSTKFISPRPKSQYLPTITPHSASLTSSNLTTTMEYDDRGAPAPQKKKRAYAAQAYEFGANTPQQNVQQPPGPAYGAFGTQPIASPQLGGPQVGAPGVVGGQPPIPGPGPTDQLANQFGQMNVQTQPPTQAPPLMAQNQNMNQLYPSDLINQPFQVSELDLPPPPIHLPPNTSVTPSPYANCPPKYVRSTLNTVPTTHSLLKKSRLPFALVISPYTSLHDNEDPVCYNKMCVK